APFTLNGSATAFFPTASINSGGVVLGLTGHTVVVGNSAAFGTGTLTLVSGTIQGASSSGSTISIPNNLYLGNSGTSALIIVTGTNPINFTGLGVLANADTLVSAE